MKARNTGYARNVARKPNPIKILRLNIIMSNLEENYMERVIPLLKGKFGYMNIFAVPKIEKIVVNSGVGKLVASSRGTNASASEDQIIADIIEEMMLITGQRPQVILAKKSIAGFKLRKGTITGLRVTLRGKVMYDFLDRLINISFPRIRDFRGLDEKSVDEHGSMTIGIREQIAFAEIPHDRVRRIWGMEVTIVTSAKTKKEGVELLREIGIPFRKDNLDSRVLNGDDRAKPARKSA